MKKRTFVLLLALVLVFGAAVGGTVAWLTDQTDTVVNTFTTSDVDITLTESTGAAYKMIPGATIDKDPLVTVKADSERCWLFVKLEKSDNFDDFMTYAMAEGWTQGDGINIPANVYYLTVNSADADSEYPVIKDNKVTVKDNVTKTMMNGLTANNYPTLTVTAYACQYEKGDTNFTAADAWDVVKPA